MPSRVTSFCVPNELRSRINIASAAYGLSSSEFIRGACQAALDTLEERDPALRAHFAFLTEREAQAERSVVPA